MTGEQTTVSIITPAYNAARFLVETIESVLSQSYPSIEYLVIDDGSSDETAAVLQRYQGQIRAERHENMGEARTVNRGFELTHGELVAIVSADDPLLAGIVEAMVDIFRERPEILVAYPDWEMIDDRGDTIRHVETYDYSYRDMVRWHHCFPGPGTFMRRELIEAVGGRNPRFRYTSDFEFWLRAGLRGPFTRVPSTLARYRHHSESTSVSQRGRERALEHIELAQKLFARQDLPTAVRRVRREALSSAYWIAGSVLGPDEQELRRRYWRRALVSAPLTYLTEYRRSRLPVIVPVLLGRHYQRAMKLWLYRCAVKRRLRRAFGGS